MAERGSASAISIFTTIFFIAVGLLGFRVAAMQGDSYPAAPSIDSMTRAEFEDAVKAAMPLPILRLMRWRTLGQNNYAIEMSLAGIPQAPQPAMHVTFHTPADADRSVLLNAIRAAGEEARALMRRLGIQP